MRLLILCGVLCLTAAPALAEPPATCTYKTYEWNVNTKRSVNHREVSKAYADLTAEERSAEEPRCSVCSQDQVEIKPAELGWPDLKPFLICHVYADSVKEALRSIAAAKTFDIKEISAYRVGRTRGKVVDGLRSEFSNHSYGTAIDINASSNGLYNQCNIKELSTKALQKCRLGMGGAWDPERRPRLTIVKDGIAYQAFTSFWKWGGEIEGNMKDIMHFSPSGF